MRRALALAALVLWTEACGLLFSLDGYEGPADAGTFDDALDVGTADQGATDVQDAPVAEAAAEASPGDADVDAHGDAGAAPWCSRQSFDAATWCFDYDEPDAQILPASTGGGATVAIHAAGDPVSPPDGLVVSIPLLATSAVSAFGIEVFSPPNTSPSTAEMAFDFQTDAGPVVFTSAMYWYRGGASPVTYTIDYGTGVLVLRVTEQNPDAGNPVQRYPASTTVTDTLWHRYALVVQASGDATLQLDGVTVASAPSPFGAVWALAFQWGVTYSGGPTTMASTYQFDDVVLQVR